MAMNYLGKAAGYASQVLTRTVKTEVQHLATGGASTSTGQAGRSETPPVSEQPRTQTPTDGTNKIVASDTSTVRGNTMVGKQRKRGRNAPSGSRTKRRRSKYYFL
ncbi:uncharacterized protein LOC105444900 [Strongylocentrotus purpuratus]|uniref:Uncharacterized protein n=1 Tax=Strongylocentrotus purpuratus TaxID=7668 RepID=A0A7M7HLC7_STRPU|nr:uncharacterized protein LOC105444900 [Strongylocentrotus purpuratus]|eukprot:XP_011678034.1 PREDICTED: uncharacterized protein LOC105444900 [Strongylocentrotus purpuratus]